VEEKNKMALYKLLENGNPILKVSLSGLSEDLDRETLTENLVETMREYKGIGLSAPQCAVMERVFVMYSDINEQKIMACYDPHILEYSEKTVLMDEGCLTYPGLWLKVRRPISIKACWEDTKGTKGEYELFGLEARIFQHEYDHMEGLVFIDHVSKLKLDMAKKRIKKLKKRSMISKT
jgi:peptide deformylase